MFVKYTSPLPGTYLLTEEQYEELTQNGEVTFDNGLILQYNENDTYIVGDICSLHNGIIDDEDYFLE